MCLYFHILTRNFELGNICIHFSLLYMQRQKNRWIKYEHRSKIWNRTLKKINRLWQKLFPNHLGFGVDHYDY